MPFHPTATEQVDSLAIRDGAPALDLQDALLHLGGDTDLLADVCRLFLQEYRSMLDRVRSALEADDAAEVQRSAHRLKGAVLYLGAERAAQRLFRLESMGEARRLQSAWATFREIEALLDDAARQVQQWLLQPV
jgi:HPt (histidine-containing phosphotransfer) domain-containing protein